LNLFEWTLKINGFPLKEAQAKLQQIQAVPEADYPAYLEKQKWDIVRYHYQNNKCYQDLVGPSLPERWEDLPIMTKADLQQPLGDRLSSGYTKKNVYVNKTSGSSGHPFVFAKDKFCHALTWAQIIDRFSWYNIDFNEDLQARFYGIPLDPINYAKERLKDRLSKRYRFSIFDLSDDKLEKALKTFERKKFVYVNGYTSSIVLFARFLKRQNICLQSVCPSLRYCMVTSEMLFPSDKALIEQSFGVPVINEYGASEMDLIAFTNRAGDFQLNQETILVEVLNDLGEPCEFDTPGRLVLTSLYNKAHPMIRYEIGDIGVLDRRSSPKKPLLKQLIGRTNDVARLPDGKVVPGLTFYYVTKSIIEDGGRVKEFVVHQTQPDAFQIQYVSDGALTKAEMDQIIKSLNTYLGQDLKLSFERKEQIERSASGKLKQFTTELD